MYYRFTYYLVVFIYYQQSPTHHLLLFLCIIAYSSPFIITYSSPFINLCIIGLFIYYQQSPTSTLATTASFTFAGGLVHTAFAFSYIVYLCPRAHGWSVLLGSQIQHTFSKSSSCHQVRKKRGNMLGSNM